ncbi:MAG: hypothetical protein ACREOO_12735 [bacterium]
MEARLSSEVMYLAPEHESAGNCRTTAGQPPKGEQPDFCVILKNNGLVPVQVVGLITSPVPCVHFATRKTAVRQAGRKTRQGHSSGMIHLAPGEMREIEGWLNMAKLRQAMRTPAAGAQMPSAQSEPFSPPPKSYLQEAPPILGLKDKREKLPVEPAPARPMVEESKGETRRHSLELHVQVQLSPPWQAPPLELTVLPPPEFELLTPALHLLPAPEAGMRTTKCAPAAVLRLCRGIAKISALESAHPGIRLELETQNGLPAELQASGENNELRFLVEVANEVIASHRKKGLPLQVDLNVICSAPPGVFQLQRAPLQIIPRLFAHLAFPDMDSAPAAGLSELKTWALAGRVRDLPVRVKNDGDQDLEIFAVEATRELGQLMRKSPALPTRLAPQEIATFNFMLDLRTAGNDLPAPAPEVSTGLVAFRYRTAEKGSESAAQFALQVETRTPSAFKGVAALDFGASDSCLAVLDPGDGVSPSGRLLDLQGETFTPAVLAYRHAGPEKERNYEVGHAAAGTQRSLAQAWYVVEDLKRSLQHEQARLVLPAQTTAPIMLTNAAILSDYLGALLRAAENRLAGEIFQRSRQQPEADFGACMLQELLVTCPATFTFQQKQILRQTLAGLGVNVNAETFQSAAAMSCFSELGKILSSRTAESSSAGAGPQPLVRAIQMRHVLAYDSGAAFTDIALVRLEYAARSGKKLEESGAVKVRTTILGLDGDDQFGGQNVTAAMAKYLAQQAVAQLGHKLKKRAQVPLWFHPGTLPVNKIEQIGFLNWKCLWHHAEQLKRRLTLDPALVESRTPPMTLQIVVDKKLETATIAPLAVKAGFLEKILVPRLELHLRKMQKLVRQAGLRSPDLIYLSGRSAVLPAVRMMITSAFNSRVVFAGTLHSSDNWPAANPAFLQNLKASVALGSVQYLRLLQNGGIFFRSSI